MGDTIVSASKEESSVPEVHIPSYTRTTGVLSTRPEPARQLSCARGPASCRPPPNPHPPLSPLSAPPPLPWGRLCPFNFPNSVSPPPVSTGQDTLRVFEGPRVPSKELLELSAPCSSSSALTL